MFVGACGGSEFKNFDPTTARRTESWSGESKHCGTESVLNPELIDRQFLNPSGRMAEEISPCRNPRVRAQQRQRLLFHARLHTGTPSAGNWIPAARCECVALEFRARRKCHSHTAASREGSHEGDARTLPHRTSACAVHVTARFFPPRRPDRCGNAEPDPSRRIRWIRRAAHRTILALATPRASTARAVLPFQHSPLPAVPLTEPDQIQRLRDKWTCSDLPSAGIRPDKCTTAQLKYKVEMRAA